VQHVIRQQEFLCLCGENNARLWMLQIRLTLYRIHGGGFVQSHKAAAGTPGGLIKSAQGAGGAGLVYVSLNYRLGALGFLSGETLKAAGGVANVGFYDQRLALE
jgi:carboxylesterase type B